MTNLNQITNKSDMHGSADFVELVHAYKVLNTKLAMFSDVVPDTIDDATKIMTEEAKYIDAQSHVLMKAIDGDVRNLNDVKQLFDLWYLEAIKHTPNEEISLSDHLVLNLYNFFHNLESLAALAETEH